MKFSPLSDASAKHVKEASEPNWIEGHVLNPFVNAIAITPYNAVANVVNFVKPGEDLLGKQEPLAMSETTFLTPGWFVQNVSSGLGMIAPYVLAGKAAGAGMRGTAGSLSLSGPAANFMKSELAAQATGAAMFDFARDTHAGETRWGNSLGGAVAFTVFGKGNAFTGTADSFMARQISRAGVGAVGGMAGFTSARLASGEGVGLEELVQVGITGGAMNVALPPTQHALTKGFERAGTAAHDIWYAKPVKNVWRSSPVQDAYWSTRGTIRDGYTEARRQTYEFLNDHNLRYPWQRLRDLVSPREVPVVAAKLTAENNPISAFEKALPEYFKRIQEREQVYNETVDRRRQHEIFKEMKEVRSDFALQLLTLWHGTAEQPGIKSYSDAELATTTANAQRVANIRHALTQTAKSDYPNADPLTAALVELAPKGIANELPLDSYAMDGIATAKEKFFKYDEQKLAQTMKMPPMHHHMDHESYVTPLTWMPYEPTSQIANLFHGSMSNSLPSVMREGRILPAHELRLRGIDQNTGESAGREHAKYNVSITREFNEAWAYHRASPERLTNFPVVYGISDGVIPRARRADIVEPGEILVDKMDLGHTLWSRLGLRKREITHIYVPDGEVQSVSQQLWANRVKGVKVVGLNELKTPPWKPELTVEQMIELGYR